MIDPAPHQHAYAQYLSSFQGSSSTITPGGGVQLLGSLTIPIFSFAFVIEAFFHGFITIGDAGFWDFDVRWYPAGSGSFTSLGINRCLNGTNANISGAATQLIRNQTPPGMVALYSGPVSSAANMNLSADFRFNNCYVKVTPMVTNYGVS